MEKKRLAYVDYWSHQDTKSGDFLREIFSEEFEIINFWWKPNEKIPLDEINKFENIFFFHVMFPHQIMKKFSGKKFKFTSSYSSKLANKRSINAFINRLIKCLDEIGFLQPKHKRNSMLININNIFHRFELSQQELHILQGIFSNLINRNN